MKMEKLKHYKLSELYEMSSGISTKKEQAGHGAPFLSFRTVFNNCYIPNVLEDRMDTSEQEQNIFSVKKGDVFLTRTSETIDELGMSSVALKDYPNATYSGFLKRLRPLQSGITYDRYMAFYFRSAYFRKAMNNNASMTLRASLNEEIFSYITVALPDYETQVKIGDFLYSIEEKIRNNSLYVSELESMAKDIYDYWFVQFDFPDDNGKPYKSSGGKMVWNEELKRDIPEGWKADRLGCLISKISTGLNPRDNFKFVDKGIDYYTVKNLCVDGHLDNSGCDHIDRSAQSIIHERSNISIGDILYASIAPLGRTYLITDAPENWEINESIFSIRPNTDKTTSVFLQMYLKSEYLIKLFEQCSVGSIFKGVRIDMLQNSLVLIPSFSIVKKFTNQIKDIVLMQHNKWKENAELTSLRDFLLPLLMNGQVKIGDMEA